MRDFDTIGIQEMSKNDMLLILEALTFAGSNSDEPEFLRLRDEVVEELSALAEIPKDEFLLHLSK